MKIAIPVFNNRVSPVFDWTTRLLMIETNEAGEVQREERKVPGISPADRVERLADSDVNVLLCGGISAAVLSLVEARGIRVIPWLAGEIDEVLQAFLSGGVPADRFLMPGCCKARQRRRGRGRMRGGRNRGPKGIA